MTKLGAYSYLPKPWEPDRLIGILKEAREARSKQESEFDQTKLGAIIFSGESPVGILRNLPELEDGRKPVSFRFLCLN